ISMSDALPKIYLARHGETAWSITGQHTGRTDLPLTPEGEQNAERLQVRLQGKRFAQVLTSPLQRARRTSELAFGPGALIEPNLSEWDYGEYEGRRTKEIRADRPNWSLFRDGCPGGETLAQVSSRTDRLVKRLRSIDGDSLLFAHKDILRVL